MASIASSSAAPDAEVARPQAGPLPTKRGEIGFRPELDARAPSQPSEQEPTPALPARHPADRDAPPSVPEAAHLPAAIAGEIFTSVPLSTDTPPPAATAPVSAPDTRSTRSSGKRSILSFLETAPKVFGVHSVTWLRFALQVSLICATIAAWVLIVMRMGKKGSSSSQNSQDSDSSSNGFSTVNANPVTAAIFIHVAFGVTTIAQFLFLERCIFRMRAERFMFTNPNSILPLHLRRELGSSPPLAIAPWNRPPLPTYAAALADSGVGTGDPEDNEIAAIAVAPAPAYGKTRGSTLLLAGVMTEAHLAAQRTGQRLSQMSATSYVMVRPGSQMTERQDRPVSYRSTDSAWDECVNAARARDLEETLSQLEQGNGSANAARR